MFANATIQSSHAYTAPANDADAQTYINAVEAAGRTLSGTEEGYINTLFLAGKAHGWWAELYDAGLLMWGTSGPSRVTFKGVSTLTDVSSPTYSSTGVAFDGVTNYISTDINPSTALTVDDTHLAIYCETAPEVGTKMDIGCKTGDTNEFALTARTTGGVATVIMYRNNGATGSVGGANTAAAFIVGSRTSNTLLTLYKNGSSIGTPLTASNPNATLCNLVMFIGGVNLSGVLNTPVARTFSFWSVGGGLTSTQVGDMSTDVNAFMTSMGINVY